jgi:hypothetical protein
MASVRIAAWALFSPLYVLAATPTAVPEIAALLPSGPYTGHAIQAVKRLDLALVVRESKPGGRFSGTVHLQQGTAPCNATFRMSGDMKPSGAVHIESRAGVPKGCERTFVLNLAGNELKGTMLAAEGTYQVALKRAEQ